MLPVRTILLVVAFVLLVMAALNVPSGSRVNLLAAGLAVWVLAILLPV